MQPTYYAMFTGRCFTPVKWFVKAQKALELAPQAADALHPRAPPSAAPSPLDLA